MEEDKQLSLLLVDAMDRFRRPRMKQFLPKTDIRQSEMALLMRLHGCNCSEGVMTSRISTLLRIAPPSVTPAINSLEKQRLIERVRSESDRRIVRIRTTAKGDEVISRTREHLISMVDTVVDELGERDARELIRILNKINNYLEQTDLS